MTKNKNKIIKQLKNLSGEKIYQRGFDYFENNLVSNLTVEEIENFKNVVIVSGEVKGEDIYVGNFLFDLKNNRVLETNCDCPYTSFCKHTVALSLKFLEQK